MNNIRNLNIWKKEEPKTANLRGLRDVDISELSLSARSFNSLKRADCHTVGDILDHMDEEGNGLRTIRNLGIRSEKEIKETIDLLREQYAEGLHRPEGEPGSKPVRHLVKPAKTTMSRKVEDFHLSRSALNCLHASGIQLVRDLYRGDIRQEPGWFAVRELFEQILLQ
ncbi:MAG: hypothetical protein IJI24_09825 [Lachnospiraceae bacterium]|nr:hypothetical protein [Lachnospiraceae bacterium]